MLVLAQVTTRALPAVNSISSQPLTFYALSIASPTQNFVQLIIVIDIAGSPQLYT